MCNSGVGLTPTIDGVEHHFSAGGLCIGLVLLIDDETRTYWDHITGEAVHGPLVGKTLESWPLQWRSVSEALKEWPDLEDGTRPMQLFTRWYGFSGTFPGCELHGG